MFLVAESAQVSPSCLQNFLSVNSTSNCHQINDAIITEKKVRPFDFLVTGAIEHLSRAKTKAAEDKFRIVAYLPYTLSPMEFLTPFFSA